MILGSFQVQIRTYRSFFLMLEEKLQLYLPASKQSEKAIRRFPLRYSMQHQMEHKVGFPRLGWVTFMRYRMIGFSIPS